MADVKVVSQLPLLLFGIFAATRFFFLADYPHFYDSPEYLRESATPTFFQSLAASHESVHPLWLFLTQTSQRLAPGLSAWEVSLVSAVAGLLTLILFYRLVKKLFGAKVALLTLTPLVFFPHLWLIQTNILHESLDALLFMSSLYCFSIFLVKKTAATFLLAVVFLALALGNFVGLLLWTPVFVGLVIFQTGGKSKSALFHSGLLVSLACCLALIGLYLLLTRVLPDPGARLRTLIFGYGGGGVLTGWNVANIARLLRNDLLILVHGYSLGALVVPVSLVSLQKNKKYPHLIFFLSFFVPFVLAGRFWYGGLFGRYSALVAWPLALLMALLPSRRLYAVSLILVILAFFPVFRAYRSPPVPEIQKNLLFQLDIQPGELVILSDYQRPQLPHPQAFYVSGDREVNRPLEAKITQALAENKPVFISAQAATFPYWQYDGQQIHIISKGDSAKAALADFLKGNKLATVAANPRYPLLNLYQLEPTP